MKTGMIVALCAGVVAGGVLAAGLQSSAVGTSRQTQATPPNATRIATVNLESVFNSLKERATRQAELDARKSVAEAELAKLANELKDMQTKIEAMPAGAGRDRAMGDFLRRQVQAEVERRIADAELERMRAATFRLLYEKINDAARRLAQQRGFTMVMAADDALSIPASISSEDMQRVIGLRRLLWVDPGQDITRDLITMMDNEFSAGGSATAPASGKAGN
jgi:Skp family chaperone for outer membrane proteins